MKVFIDTSAFIALLVEKEQFHEKVAKKYYAYRQERAIFFTSYYILDELLTRLLYYKESIDVKKYIDILKESINAKELTVLQIDEAVIEKSLEIYVKFSEHKLSLTDATTYILYKELKLDEIYTLDSDFRKIGVKTSF